MSTWKATKGLFVCFLNCFPHFSYQCQVTGVISAFISVSLFTRQKDFVDFCFTRQKGLGCCLLSIPFSLFVINVKWTLWCSFLALMSSDRRDLCFHPDVYLQGRRTVLTFAFNCFQAFLVSMSSELALVFVSFSDFYFQGTTSPCLYLQGNRKIAVCHTHPYRVFTF